MIHDSKQYVAKCHGQDAAPMSEQPHAEAGVPLYSEESIGW